MTPVFVTEFKKYTEFNDDKKQIKACEQALFDACVFGVKWACATDGAKHIYVNVEESFKKGEVVYSKESRPISPSVMGTSKNCPTRCAWV